MFDIEILRYGLMFISGVISLTLAARVLFDWQKDRLVGAEGEEFDATPSQGNLETVEAPASYQDKVLTLEDDEVATEDTSYENQVGTVFDQSQDDLTKIEGIGPKTEEILNEHDIYSYSKLASIKPLRLKAMLDKAGSTFRLHDPSSWPQQAELAAKGDWKRLIHLQDRLTAKKSSSRAKSTTSSINSSLNSVPIGAKAVVNKKIVKKKRNRRKLIQ